MVGVVLAVVADVESGDSRVTVGIVDTTIDGDGDISLGSAMKHVHKALHMINIRKQSIDEKRVWSHAHS